jgi:hypothetical protein
MDEKYRSRKFGLAVTFSLVSIIALFSGDLSGGEFVASITVILGLYGAANIMDKQ